MANTHSTFGEGYLTAEQKQHQARAWIAQSPRAGEARSRILDCLSQAPIHTACLGEFGECFDIPKPVSAVVRELCGNLVSFYSATTSPTGCPAIALTERASEDAYWLKFRRKGFDTEPGTDVVSPWEILGLGRRPSQEYPDRWLDVRAEVFASFVAWKYGPGTIKGMATICAEFKKESGTSFSAFFEGMRPAEFMNSPVGRKFFNWSWTTATPPCLNCEVKNFNLFPQHGPKFFPPNAAVEALEEPAAREFPENINYALLAKELNLSESEANVCYLRALRAVLQRNDPPGRGHRRSIAAEDAVRQLLDVSRELASAADHIASVANRIASIAERLIESSDK